MRAWLPLPACRPGLAVAIRWNPGTTTTATGPIIETVAAHPVSFKDAAAEAGVPIGRPCARREGEWPVLSGKAE
jgi:hypothetical protein